MVKGRQVWNQARVTRTSMYTIPSNEVSTWYTGHVQMGVFIREEPPWVTLKPFLPRTGNRPWTVFFLSLRRGLGMRLLPISSLVGDNSSILFNLTIVLCTRRWGIRSLLIQHEHCSRSYWSADKINYRWLSVPGSRLYLPTFPSFCKLLVASSFYYTTS